MRKNNPACYECKKDRNGIHTWKRLPTRRAICVRCELEINQEDAAEVFNDHA